MLQYSGKLKFCNAADKTFIHLCSFPSFKVPLYARMKVVNYSNPPVLSQICLTINLELVFTMAYKEMFS